LENNKGDLVMKKYEIEEDDLMQLIIDSLTLRDLYIGDGYKYIESDESDEAIIKEAENNIKEYKEINNDIQGS
jgi:hypothetical protein